MRLRDMLLGCALALVAGCDHAAAPLPPAVDHDAQGSWGQDTHGVITPGNSFVMALTESDGAITGTGSFTGEAGPYGGVQVTGTVHADSVKLQIVFTAEPTIFPNLPPATTQFAGFLVNKNQVKGQLTRSDATTSSFDLIRLVISDPH
jgi:hypothetical protein